MRNPERRSRRAIAQMLPPSLGGSLRAASPVRDRPPPTGTRVVPTGGGGGECIPIFGYTFSADPIGETWAEFRLEWEIILPAGADREMCHITWNVNVITEEPGLMRMFCEPANYLSGPVTNWPVVAGWGTDPDLFIGSGALTVVDELVAGSNMIGLRIAVLDAVGSQLPQSAVFSRPLVSFSYFMQPCGETNQVFSIT